MAASEAAVPASMSKVDRRSPPAAASKRDRRRQIIIERITVLNDKMQRDKDYAYRDQLQKIQFEMNLVQRFDPYDPKVLDTITDLQKEHQQSQGHQNNAENARSLMDMAGIRFPEFIDSIEDLVEIRDAQLAQSKNEFDRKVQQYKNTHAYKSETAKREHRSLTGTLRDRLINTLNSKKNRLTKEKEVLEISDSNALLLNPTQFSLTNPGSPGGAHGKRATRLRKDAEDLSLFDTKKRKRNNGDDDGSPGPARRAMDGSNGTTALWQSEKARAAAKQNGPVYSLDKLFTDKELSMHYNQAAVAAHQFILRHRASGNGSSPEDSDFGGNEEDDDDSESVPSAPMMERQVSHATRSTRGGGGAGAGGAGASAASNHLHPSNGNHHNGNGSNSNHNHHLQNFLDDKILGIEAIANFELPGNLELMHKQEPPKMPPFVPQQYLKPYPRTADQNFPVPLSPDDISSDLQVMGIFKHYDQSHKPGAHLDAGSGLRRVLEAVAIPYHQGRYVGMTAAPREEPDQLRDALGLPHVKESKVRDDHLGLGYAIGGQNNSSGPGAAVLASAGVPMSRQSSLGGVAMSRQGSNTRAKGRRG